MRLGVDLGGTKIEIIALGDGGEELLRRRTPTPKTCYQDILCAVRDLVAKVEKELKIYGTVGIGIPGIISPVTGLVKNANSTRLIGHALDKDLQEELGRPVRLANDANCFALSEATDGSGAGYNIVFGVILGTGVGGGICIDGREIRGAHAIAGEWGHNPLPGSLLEELQLAPPCYCGKIGCIESWCSGPALEAQFAQATGRKWRAKEIADAAGKGDAEAVRMMEKYFDRLARSLASIVNVLDPDVIVLGGGLSNIDALYRELPRRIEEYAFKPEGQTRILKNKHGDSSGVRGAAWLWCEHESFEVLK